MQTLISLWHAPQAGALLRLAALLVLALLVGALTRFVLLRVIARVARHTRWEWDDAMLEHGVFGWLGRMAPPLVIYLGLDLVDGLPVKLQGLIGHLALALAAWCAAMAMVRALSALEFLYHRNAQGQRSIKGVLQLAKLALIIVGALLVIGVLTGKDLTLLLSGLGAMSAVLILIFKDTILGFVAGLQLSATDMLRVGDWITMPAAGADGDVIDITLYTVKVRNFDKTIVTIPTWKMIAESYQNWRGMQESGGRRIKRSLRLDAGSVRFVEPAQWLELVRLDSDVVLEDQHLSVLQPWPRPRPTNLGAFRAYASAYLAQHPRLRKDMTCMVRQLESQAQGIPLELYCFTDTTAWAQYEAIQADLFDYLIAVLPQFGLRLYQQPGGADLQPAMAALQAAQAQSTLST